MKYCSTRGGVKGVDFSEIIFSNYADDGGLFVPEYIPIIDRDTLKSWSNMPYYKVAYNVLLYFVNDDIKSDLLDICKTAYSDMHFDTSDVVPLKTIDNNLMIMELFHGKTLAFKDLGLILLAFLMDYYTKKNGSKNKVNIVVQTSGDTGPAAASSVISTKSDNINIFVLYPLKQASDVQQSQLTTLMPKYSNVFIYGTDRNMDDQRFVSKDIFADKAFAKQYNLSAMNSINFVRVLGQLIYYVYYYLKCQPNCDKMINYIIPSGAFGNTLACCFAKKMGIPINDIIPCCNENDIIYRVFNNGDLSQDAAKYEQTFAPAMDIVIPYNIERYLYLTLNQDCGKIKTIMNVFENKEKYQFDDYILNKYIKSIVTLSYKTSNKNIVTNIEYMLKKYNYLCCPHTSCAVYGYKQYINTPQFNPNIKTVLVATAHPGKFPDIIKDNTSINITDSMLDHPFLPKPNDIKEFIHLKDCIDWRNNWANKIKKDIMQANKIKSKL
mmetsp:Transcript_26801/g.32610  ORF Transcript_26801/g.32610 Transcript_26801/m.32610 type:complete len:495 (+) Transcript_26801:41-1525(+)